MSQQYAATYLNDHLAGSVVALELSTRLQQEHAGTPLSLFAAELHADITADRDELTALLARLAVAESQSRKAVAWLGEKLTRLKMRWTTRPTAHSGNSQRGRR